MIHRYKDSPVTVGELKQMIRIREELRKAEKEESQR
jgi:hypothetical protein